MIDPIEALMKTQTILPTVISSTVASATSFPTVLPDVPTFEHATASGFRTLWVVTVIMALASAAFTAMSWNVPLSRRLYYTVTASITIIAALSYFGMATNHGVTYHLIPVTEHHKHVPDTQHDVYRQVFWARYVDWSLTTPLLILDLGLLAGMSGGHLVMAIGADLVMILTGLFAAFGDEHNPQKWGWYTISCVSFIFVIWHLILNGGAAARARSNKLGTFYGSISGYTILLWIAYPIIWGVADGARILSVNQEILAYAILDVLAKPVFGAWLLLQHSRMSETNVELGGWWANGLSGEGRLRLDDDEGA